MLQPFLSKAWSESSLLGVMDSVDAHHRLLRMSKMTEEDMKKELDAPRSWFCLIWYFLFM